MGVIFSDSSQAFPKHSQFKTTHLFISKDNFLRGDSSRKVQHQQQRKPRKKTKPPALTKKHKKKRRRGPRRPQKPIPPAVPQGNLSMPTSVSLPVETAQIRSVMVLTTPSIISVALQLGPRSHSIDEPRPCSLQCNFYQIPDWVRSEIKFLTVTQKADAEIENLIVCPQIFLL